MNELLQALDIVNGGSSALTGGSSAMTSGSSAVVSLINLMQAIQGIIPQ